LTATLSFRRLPESDAKTLLLGMVTGDAAAPADEALAAEQSDRLFLTGESAAALSSAAAAILGGGSVAQLAAVRACFQKARGDDFT
jgi:hypothetical protein